MADATVPLVPEPGYSSTWCRSMPTCPGSRTGGSGRAEPGDELPHAEPALRDHFAEQVRALLAHPELPNALPGIAAQADLQFSPNSWTIGPT